MSPRATTRPSSASITNTLRLLCTSSPTYIPIGLPSSLVLGRIATPWSAVDLTAAEGSPPSSIRLSLLRPPGLTGDAGGRADGIVRTRAQSRTGEPLGFGLQELPELVGRDASVLQNLGEQLGPIRSRS